MKDFISVVTLIAVLSIGASNQKPRNSSTGPRRMVSDADANAASLAIANSCDRLEQTETQLKETLIDLEKQSWVAWQRRDGKFFDRFLSDDHIEVGVSGVANKTAIVAFVASPLCVVKSYAVDKFKLTVIAQDTALLNYHAEQDTTCNGSAVPSPAWASSLYVKRGGRWFNVMYQQTPASAK